MVSILVFATNEAINATKGQLCFQQINISILGILQHTHTTTHIRKQRDLTDDFQ